MQITRASDYAVRVMIHLAGLPPASTVQQSQLSKVTDVSGHFLSKVLQQLVRAGLIRSQRGAGGGYSLSSSASRVTLLDVVEVMEGPVRLNHCLQEGPTCERKSWCPAHPVWAEAQAAVVKVLRNASIASLASQMNTDPGPRYRSHEESVWISGVPQKFKRELGREN